MSIKTFNDGGRFLLVIEPVGEEEMVLIKKIKEVCGIENVEEKTLANLLPPTIPQVKIKDTSAQETSVQEVAQTSVQPVQKDETVSPGYIMFHELTMKIKRKELQGPERDKALDTLKKLAVHMKANIPEGETLHYVIKNFTEMFSERKELEVLEKLHISKEQLLSADSDIKKKAYMLAVA